MRKLILRIFLYVNSHNMKSCLHLSPQLRLPASPAYFYREKRPDSFYFKISKRSSDVGFNIKSRQKEPGSLPREPFIITTFCSLPFSCFHRSAARPRMKWSFASAYPPRRTENSAAGSDCCWYFHPLPAGYHSAASPR